MNQVYKSFFFSGGRIFYFEIKQLKDEFVHKKWLYQLYVYPLQTNHSLWDQEKYYYALYALIFLYLIGQTFCTQKEEIGRDWVALSVSSVYCIRSYSVWYDGISGIQVFLIVWYSKKKISSWYEACLIGNNVCQSIITNYIQY